jgi:MiaB-like tRNA modifying enzyme
MNNKIFAEVYGCSGNISDFEIALGLLKKEGYEIVDDVNDSDLNIIFTCIVKTPTADRMIYRIKELTKLKKPLIVAGCMPKTEREIIERINPSASLVGPNSLGIIPDVVKSALSYKKIVFTKDLKKPKVCMPRFRRNQIIEICEIASGCLSNCSYCEVKFARGKLFSYPQNLILKEIKNSLNQGCKEIWLTSQDCGCYGRDINSSLPELLQNICKIRKKFFIRIGMMNPIYVDRILDDLINSYNSEKVFKFLHLPVQSGSDRILKMMNRFYTIKDFKNIVKEFKKEFPFLTLSTDVIVGFPSEKNKDFQKTFDLIEKIKPDIVNISKFGPRPGTEAAKMEQLSRKIIDQRTKKLIDLVEKIKIKNNQKWLNWDGDVLIDEIGERGGLIGRNFAYKPVLTDGKLGEFKKIKIKSIHSTYLIGNKVKK